MADDTTVAPAAPAAPQPEPDEGFLHSIATSIGIDPEAVVSTAKMIRQHPWQVAKDAASAQADEFVDAGHHLRETARSALTGVASSITNPEAKAKAFERMQSPGIVNKLVGAEEYASSVVPFIGGNIAKSEEQASQGNLPGAAGTLTGTIAPLVTETEPVEAVKTHLAEAGKTFVQSAKEEAHAALNATAPEGSLEAGFAKLGGKKIKDAPKAVVPEPSAVPEAPKPEEEKPSDFSALGGKEVKPAPETTAAYHPDLQKIVDQFGTHTDPTQAANGPSFVTPDGKFVPLRGTSHDAAIDWATGQKGPSKDVPDNRVPFINDSKAIRIRPTSDRAGTTLHISVPKEGISPEQIETLKQGVSKSLGYGNVMLETADNPRDIKTAYKEDATDTDIEPMLKEIGAHPDQTKPAAELKISTDNNGTKWAENADGVRVSVPKRIADEDVQKYAADKVTEQAAMQTGVKAKAVSPNTDLQASAQKYAKAQGMDEINHSPVEVDADRAREIAKTYDAAKHEPERPEVKSAYDALKKETLAQFHHLQDDAGLKFEPQEKDPYNSAGEMMNDIKQNNKLKVFTGSSTGEDHPLSEVAPGTGGQTYNTIFRWVHDAMGHAAGGHDFSEAGEKSATEAHAQMYSDAARPAMRNETEGQTSWFFHNPEVESGITPPGKFAEQKAAIIPDAWHDTAGSSAAKNEAGGIDPRTGKSDTTGMATEIAPELRQSLDHAPTSKDFKAFYDQHKDVLDKHPELRIGWDNNSAVEGGHEINVGAVGPNAAEVARKLDQKSAFNIDKGEVVPTGGSGLKTKFKNYPLESRLSDLSIKSPLEPSTGGTAAAPAAPPAPAGSEKLPLVSSRMPSRKVNGETVEEHTNGALTSDMQAAHNAPGFIQKLADRVASTPGFKDPGGDADSRANAYIRHIADNVKYVWGKLKPEEIKRDEQWYPVGAHQRGIEVAKTHGIDPHQAYGVTAALSPLTDWDVNTSLAERATNIWKNQQNTKFTPEMRQAANDILSVPAMKKFKSVYKNLEGKTLGELKTTAEQAHWLRLYDEAHNPREYQTWNPDGTSNGIAKNSDGSPKQVSWSFQNLIENAIGILKDGSQENVSQILGTGHKVRNFYNNQLSPNDPRFLTIDTHAVNVGQLRPMSGQTPAVKDNFGGISNKPYGLKGTYALHDAGYRLAAKELGVDIPGRIQSPTWVKIREVFPNKFKTPENQAAIDAIWKEHTDGKLTADEARDKIWAHAEGWNRSTAAEVRPAGDQRELFDAGIQREAAGGAAGRGNRGDATSGTQAVGDEGDTSFDFGANEKPVPSRVNKVSAKQQAKNTTNVAGLLDALQGLRKAGSKK